MEVRCQLHAPAASPSGKGPQYLLDRRLGGTHNWSGHNSKEKEIPSLPPARN